MPPARSSTAQTSRAARTARSTPGFQPRRVKSRAPLSRIRWDRASRIAMLGVLALLAWLWISGITSLLSTRAQAERGLAQVSQLAVENHQLLAEQKALTQTATILRDARKLGMVRMGEQAFLVTH